MPQPPPLFLLHGWGMNRTIWSPLTAQLDGEVNTLDLPGHGQTPWNRAHYTLSAWVDFALAAAPPRAVWVGWSLGGIIAQAAALRAPERVAALVGIATTPRFTQASDWPAAVDAQVLEGFATAFSENHQGTLDRFLALQLRGDPAARQLLRRLREELRHCPAPHPEALAVGLEILRHSDLRSQLAALRPPSCWIFGERDTLVPAALERDLRHYLPQATLITLPRSAHAPFLSDPLGCAQQIRNFIK